MTIQSKLCARRLRSAADRRHDRRDVRRDGPGARGARGAGCSASERTLDAIAELKRRVDDLALGLMRLGLEPGDRLGIWSPNCAEWVLTQFASAKAGLVLVNINPSYLGRELEYALNKVECKALILAPGFKKTDYIAILQSLSPEMEHRATNEWRSASLPSLRRVIRLGSDRTPGMLNFDELAQPADAADLARLAERGGAASVRRPDQYPVHVGHDRRTQGRHADAPQHPEQRVLRRRGPAAHAARPRLHPGAALPLLRHGDRQPGLRHARRDDGLPGRELRCAGGAAHGAGRALHRRSTACRRCSSPCSTIHDLPNTTSPASAPASWPARRAQSR